MRRVQIIDSHTGGEPTRVVVSGGPDLGSGSLADRVKVFRRQHDYFRSAVVNEPRGSDVLVGALLVKPSDKTCAAGVIFFNNVGYLGMCGHGTIGLVVTLAHLGRIGAGEHRIETPVGTIMATLHADGSVSVANVPSFRKAQAVTVEVPGIGAITGDVAWGGNWFFLVEQHEQRLDLANVEQLTDLAWRIRQAVNAQGFPEVDHVELFGPPKTPGAHARNFVLCPGKAYDRSPCGTGTSAKLACLAADGKLREGESWVQESIIGSTFTGSYRRAGESIVPTISGTAFVNAEATLVLDENDPFCWGIGAQESILSGNDPPTPARPSQAQDRLLRSANVREIVREKRAWHSPPAGPEEKRAGFAAWRTRGYLPHFDRKGLFQFITFRLDDALPADRRSEWQSLLEIENERERLIQLEQYLDRGHGRGALQKPEVAALVQNALLRFDGERYRLFAWVVMPNHVHALLEVLNTPLARILHSWKAYSALEANRLLQRRGRFWQVEYFDRYIRDVAHFRRAIRYIENNPVKAGLATAPEQWPWSSARFADPLSDRSAGVQPARRAVETGAPPHLDHSQEDQTRR
ncbi:MAG: 4-hydroxyproline epimerase [Chloroflexi bacterium]|nr:4-hydroxyproline epimerase [Chloroflexota bacterium]